MGMEDHRPNGDAGGARLSAGSGRLTPADAAAVDQIEAGLSEMWRTVGLDNANSAAVASLITLKAMEDRTHALARAGRISSETCTSVMHCLDEMRLALVETASIA